MPEDKFEDALQQLEEIVTDLESGEAPLEDALSAFEKGVKLVRRCHSILESAEKKIEKLTAGPEGGFETEEFEPAEEEPKKAPRKKKRIKKNTVDKPEEKSEEESLF